jgi:hypothetical protein
MTRQRGRSAEDGSPLPTAVNEIPLTFPRTRSDRQDQYRNIGLPSTCRSKGW